MGSRAQVLPKLMSIGGVARSGTSILMEVCDSHSDVALTYEFGSFLHLGESYYRHITDLKKNFFRKALIRAPRQSLLTNSKMVSLSFLLQYMIRSVPYWLRPVGAEDIRRMLHGAIPYASVVGDKLPGYHLQLHRLCQIEDMYPIVIYRDPRDVAQSLIRQRETVWSDAWPDHDPLDTAARVGREWVKGMAQQDECADKVYSVRYEEFVTAPDSVVEGLGAWLGVDPTKFETGGVHPSSVGKWKQRLTRLQLDKILSIAGPTMERFEYL